MLIPQLPLRDVGKTVELATYVVQESMKNHLGSKLLMKVSSLNELFHRKAFTFDCVINDTAQYSGHGNESGAFLSLL